MLQIENVHFGYNAEPVLRGISFSVAPGMLCGLFGPNGCGKTTLFRCCLNLNRVRKGSIRVQGREIRTLSARNLARRVAYVPQEHKPPFPYLASEVVLMGRNPHMSTLFGVNRAERDRAGRALDVLGLGGIADRPYNSLSGGQRQMVLIARALVQETPLLLLDEPTSALDFSNQIRIWNTIRNVVRDRGITALACSHDPNHVAWFCDTVAVMGAGDVVALGSPGEVITESVLERIYPGTCWVGEAGSLRVVLPREAATRR